MSEFVPDREFTAIPFAQLYADIPKAAEEMYEDFDHFLACTRSQQEQLFVAVKRWKCPPEFKDQKEWLVEYMKEEFDAQDEDGKGKQSPGSEIISPELDALVTTVLDPNVTSEEAVAAASAYVQSTTSGGASTAPEEPDQSQVDPPATSVEPDIVDDTNHFSNAAPGGGGVQQEPLVMAVSPEIAKAVAEKSCVFEFYQSEPTFKKKVAAAEILQSAEDPGIHDVKADRLSVSKSLIKAPELVALLMNRRRFNKRLRSFTLPGGLLTLAGGQYLIPLACVSHVKELVDEYIAVRKELLNKFEEKYPEIIEKAKTDLAGLFDESEYPPFDAIRSAYSVQYKFVSNSVPEELARVSQELYDKERERILTECSGAAVEIEDALRKGFAELVEHFADRLGNDSESGRPKQLHESVVKKVSAFLNTFQDFNLTGDGQLGELVQQAKQLIGTATAGDIREDEDFRAKLKQGFEQIKEASTKLVEVRKRKIVVE